MIRRILQNPNAQGCLVLVAVIAIATLYLLNQRQPAITFTRPDVPATNTPEQLAAWQQNLQAELAALPSPTPTLPPSPTVFIPPTSPVINAQPIIIQPSPQTVAQVTTPSPIPADLVTPSPAFINSTPIPLPEGVDIAGLVTQPLEENPEKYQLPPEQIPLSAHPFDHYYLARPIDVTANSEYLFYYPYGSSGSEGWRVHHGLDMPNLVGEEVLAAGDGTVTFAGSYDQLQKQIVEEGQPDLGDLEVYASYGNLVVIKHDFGWRGQTIWTLYAHLSAFIVQTGQRVTLGQPLGLVGVTGNVTGPHVHFEVRLGRNSYYSTRNPILWMAPYIGHGVLAGRVTDAEGRLIDGVLVQLNKAGRITDSTTTYINPYTPNKRLWTVVPDDNWGENFAMGDIPAGEYQLVAVIDDQRYFQDVVINAGATSFVQIQVGVISTAQAVQATAIIETPLPTALPSPTP